MKFRIQKSVLQDVLQSVISVVPNKATFQVLNNVSLRLEGNMLEVCATDMDLGVRLNVEVEGERDGAVIVNARRLSDLIKNLVQTTIETISFNLENQLLDIRWSEHGNATLTGFDANDFPPIPDVEDGVVFQMAKSELAFLVEKTAFAVSSDATRLAMHGVYLEAKDGKISMVATDGHRLGKAFIEQDGVTLERGAIIPPKVLNFVLRNLANDTNVEIRISQTLVLFLSDNMQIVSKLIEGPFPQYSNVIPHNFTNTAQARTAELINKIRCVITMANARTHLVRFQINNSTLELSSSDSEVGGFSKEELAITHEGDDSFCIGFNGLYLTEILNMCKNEDVVLKLTSAVGACIIEPAGGEDMNYFFLVMPLRLSDTDRD